MNDLEELYRRLAQARRMINAALDPLTRDRLSALISEMESQIAVVEARNGDAPPGS